MWKEKVSMLMRERDLSQKQLSELSGITESSISRYLHSNQRPRIDIIVNIAKALNVTPEYLLSEDADPDCPFTIISTAIARKGKELTPEQKNELIALIVGTSR